MQENEQKISIEEVRKITGEIYNSLSKGEKGVLLDEVVGKFGDSRFTWKVRLSRWANEKEFSQMNEYLEREVHKFIGLTSGKVKED